MIKEGQIYEVTYSSGNKQRYVVTAIDEEPDTHTPVCFIISSQGIGQVSYCDDLLKHSKLIQECSNWKEAVNSVMFVDGRVLH